MDEKQQFVVDIITEIGACESAVTHFTNAESLQDAWDRLTVVGWLLWLRWDMSAEFRAEIEGKYKELREAFDDAWQEHENARSAEIRRTASKEKRREIEHRYAEIYDACAVTHLIEPLKAAFPLERWLAELEKRQS